MGQVRTEGERVDAAAPETTDALEHSVPAAENTQEKLEPSAPSGIRREEEEEEEGRQVHHHLAGFQPGTIRDSSPGGGGDAQSLFACAANHLPQIDVEVHNAQAPVVAPAPPAPAPAAPSAGPPPAPAGPSLKPNAPPPSPAPVAGVNEEEDENEVTSAGGDMTSAAGDVTIVDGSPRAASSPGVC